MSDLSLRTPSTLVFQKDNVNTNPQLPVQSYFDPGILRLEQAQIFNTGPKYLGHALAVPNVGDYYTLPQEDAGRMLIRTEQGIELVSNICRHRQAIMLKGRGSIGNQIICPLHRWTYNNHGKLLGAPHFECNPGLNLNNYRLREWNSLLFEDNGHDIHADLHSMQAMPKLNFDGYVLDHVEQHVCNYNWKTFIEVYLEDYHIGPFHPGLGNFVTCDDLSWEMGEHYSVQTVGVAKTFGKPGTDVYKQWHELLLNYRNGVLPEQGAVWLTYYPHIMVEWYPHVLTISTLYPLGVEKTLNLVEFYYPEEIAAFEREFVEAQRAAYMETCIEDDEIAERMNQGRKALLARKDNQTGPYQSPMEDGMRHFHLWYRHAMQRDTGYASSLSCVNARSNAL